MRESLVDLIGRMSAQEGMISSDQSGSWAAYREAEKLDDLSMVPELLAYYRPKLKSPVRDAIIFTIGKIGLNTRSSTCIDALLTILPQEKLKYNLDTLLNKLGDIEKPPETDLHLVFALLDDKRWLVRHAALNALANSHSPEAEVRLLEHLSRTDDKYDQTYAQASLGSIGTEAALPILRENAKSRKPDVRMSARFAIERIEERLSALRDLPDLAPAAKREP